MTTRQWGNFALVSVAVLLLIWVVLDARTPEPGFRTLVSGPITVNRIQIEAHNQAPITLVRREQSNGPPVWWIDQPIQHPAKATRITRLLSMETNPVQRSFTKPKKLKAFQLDPPLARFQFDDRHYELGGSDPLHGHRYIAHGQQISLLPDDQLELLLGGPSGLVSNHLIPPGYRIRQWKFGDTGFITQTEGADPQSLRPQSSGKVELSADAMARILSAWQDSTAFWVELSSDAPPPTEPVEIHWQNGEPARTYFITQHESGVLVYLAGTGLLYHLPERSAAALLGKIPASEINQPNK